MTVRVNEREEEPKKINTKMVSSFYLGGSRTQNRDVETIMKQSIKNSRSPTSSPPFKHYNPVSSINQGVIAHSSIQENER